MVKRYLTYELRTLNLETGAAQVLVTAVTNPHQPDLKRCSTARHLNQIRPR